MPELKLSYLLALLTVLFFFLFFHRRANAQTYLLFVLYLFPFINLRITAGSWGGLTVFDFISFYCVVFLFQNFFAARSMQRNVLYGALFILLLYLSLISSLLSQFPYDSLFTVLKSLPIFIYARFLAMECSLDPSFPFRVIKALHFVLFINLAFVVLQLIVGLAFTFYPELGYNTFNQETALVRYPGFFGDAQFQGQYLAMGSFLFLIRPFPTTRPRLLFNMIILMALVYALLLAGSRAAFTGFCIGLLFLFVIAWRQFWKYAVIFIGGLVFYLSLSPRDGVFGRSHEIKSDLQFRQKMWDKAIAISISHPFLGIGAGNYRPYTEKHVRDQYIEKNGEIIYYDHPENGYLKLLVEYGTTGFFLIGLFILLPLYKALQCYRQRRFGHNALFLIASVTSWMVAFYTVYTLSDYRILVMLTTVLVLLIRFPQPEKLTHEAA